MSDKEYQLNESRNKSETGTDKKNVLICNVRQNTDVLLSLY